MIITRGDIGTNYLDAEVPGITMTEIIIEALLPTYALDLTTTMTETIITVVVSGTRTTMIGVEISDPGREADHPTEKYGNPNSTRATNGILIGKAACHPGILEDGGHLLNS
jgi:hypothetical protein